MPPGRSAAGPARAVASAGGPAGAAGGGGRRVPAVLFAAALLLCASTVLAAPGGGSKPHLLMILQDDLGYYDTGFSRNWPNLNVTAAITAMAHDGVVLTAHYAHYWCSPTRRSFLTGRLPLHHGEMLSDGQADDIDLRWQIISQKLQPAGYASYWYGKGHTGFKSMAHLPTRRGFRNYTGFLSGSQGYTSSKRWAGERPSNDTTYSTELFGALAEQTLQQHDPATPLFLYLPFQAVHEPYDDVPGWEAGPGRSVYQGMLWSADRRVGMLRRQLELKGMWSSTLVVFSSDNGGHIGGNNFPLRGQKATNYEGGMRVAAFVSGGVIPAALRGTSNGIRFHIVDWYATFCFLAGVDPADDAPVPPLPVDPADPGKDLYGNESWPGVDGVVIWDHLMRPTQYTPSAAHPTLVLSREVILQGDYKLMTAQRGNTGEGYNPYENKWQKPDGTRFTPKGWAQTCGRVADPWGSIPFTPCLFHIATDLNETTDLGPAKPELLQLMWRELNVSWLTTFHSRSPAAMLGVCNEPCATIRWHAVGGSINSTVGPICGVPGCEHHWPQSR